MTQAEEETDENCDLETSRNTSFNETVSDSQTTPPSQASAPCDVTGATEAVMSSALSCNATAAPADVTVSSQKCSSTEHVTVSRSHAINDGESIRGTHTSLVPPSVAPKPRHIEGSFPRSVLHKAPDTSRSKPETCNATESEKVLLSKRIAELEKVCETSAAKRLKKLQ